MVYFWHTLKEQKIKEKQCINKLNEHFLPNLSSFVFHLKIKQRSIDPSKIDIIFLSVQDLNYINKVFWVKQMFLG